MKFKASDIAGFLQGEVVGDSNVVVTSVSKIEEGAPGTLAFLANPKYEHYLYQTKASIVLVNKSMTLRKEVPATLIKVDDAYQAFASLLDLYVQAKKDTRQGIEQPSYIDPSASTGEDIYVGTFTTIGKNTKIGKGVKIFPQVHIGDDVTIGDDCIIYAGARIYDDSVIGSHCIIHSGAVIGSDGFGFAPTDNGSYKKIPQIGNVVLEDHVEIGANTTIDCGTVGSTIIRTGAKIDNLVQIAHNCEVGENTVIAAQTGLAGTTKVGKNCRFGGQVGLAGHLTIGDNVEIGAQSGVSRSIKDNESLLLTPAFNIKDAAKSAIIFRNLPDMRKDLIQLRKDIKSLQKSISAESKK